MNTLKLKNNIDYQIKNKNIFFKINFNQRHIILKTDKRFHCFKIVVFENYISELIKGNLSIDINYILKEYGNIEKVFLI